MNRCYPQSVFAHAAHYNGWRLRDAGVKNVYVAVVAPIGRLIITRHSNGRLQVQGVSMLQQERANRVVHELMWDARACLIGESHLMQGISWEQAEREFEEDWQQEKAGLPPIDRGRHQE